MLKHKIEQGKFIYTLEVSPPRGVLLEEEIEKIKPLAGYFDAFNVTDCPGAKLKLASLMMSCFLKTKGFEVVMQLTGRDRNSLALQADLLAASACGIDNLLVLTGDPPFVGKKTKAKAVFELDSIGILDLIKSLNQGFSWEGEELKGKTNFFAAAAVNPTAVQLEKEIDRMKRKIDKGAKFFYTQAIFDPDDFKRFKEKVKNINAPLIAGVVLLRSEKMAKFMNDNIPGINIPQKTMEFISQAEDKKEACLEIATEIISGVKDYAGGIHIMPIGYQEVVEELMQKVKR